MFKRLHVFLYHLYNCHTKASKFHKVDFLSKTTIIDIGLK
ncbi:hypothetical protein M135_5385 [Bacteroides fragilis str. S36L5]|nr:hypothetical protein PARMER_01244 [Parabacteroides merdae ATCC 43184]EYA93452.1 hypothetical protein M135_5385 [Bacteroides fragilis str. S36L5]